jgi:hypothetical protein
LVRADLVEVVDEFGQVADRCVPLLERDEDRDEPTAVA